MEKIKLTVAESLKLNEEIDGLINEKLPVHVKFSLHNLKKKVVGYVESFQSTQKELFDKYGYQDGGMYKINKDSEGYKTFVEETDKLMKQEVEIDYNPFKLSTFENIETIVPLDVFFKLVIS